jgi:hypothetical protein
MEQEGTVVAPGLAWGFTETSERSWQSQFPSTCSQTSLSDTQQGSLTEDQLQCGEIFQPTGTLADRVNSKCHSLIGLLNLSLSVWWPKGRKGPRVVGAEIDKARKQGNH